jgi:hypothetical protein
MNQSPFSIGLIFQLLLTHLLLVVAFLYFDPFNELGREADTINMMAFGIFLPLVVSGATVILCFILGLPLKLHPHLRQWWFSRPVLQLLLLAIGILLLIFSNSQALQVSKEMTEHGEVVKRWYTNEHLSLPGWFLTGFVLIHLTTTSMREHFLSKILGSSDWTKH